MEKGQSGLSGGFQQIWTDTELEGTKFTWLLEACWHQKETLSSSWQLSWFGPASPNHDNSYCIGCFCSHVTKCTILETGCHRQHQGESIYITNFRLIHSIYSSLFLHVPTSQLIKEVKWKRQVQMFSPFAPVSYEILCQLLPILEELEPGLLR